MRRIVAVLIENEAGALSRVVGLFAQRNYNIDSLTVARTEDPTLSRITIGTHADESGIEQITKQLHKLVEVVKVDDLTDHRHLEREIMLIKVRAEGAARDEMKRIADIFRGQIVDVTESTFTIQLAGTDEKNSSFIEAIDPKLVLEVARSGITGLARGNRTLRVKQ